MNKTHRIRVLLTIVFLLFLGLFVFKVVSDQVTYRVELEKKIMINILSGIHSNVEQLINIVGRSLETIRTDMSQFLESEDGQNLAIQRITTFNKTMPLIQEVSIFDSTGKIWASSSSNKVFIPFTQIEIQEITSKEGQSSPDKNPFIFLFEPVLDEKMNGSMTIVLPILLPDKNFKGGVLAVLPTKFFLPLVQTALISDDSMAGLTWNEKTMFFQTSKDSLSECIPITEKNTLLNKHFSSGIQLSVDTGKTLFTHSKRTLVMETIQGIDKNWSANLTLTIGREYSKILKNVYISARLYSMLYLLICTLTLGAVEILLHSEKKSNLELLTHQKKLEYMAQYDQLTDLPNRTLGLDRMQGAISRVNRKEKFLAVMFIDLDGFKTINDTWGHATGDFLLKCISENMKTVLRDSDTLARFGGDEFIAIFEDMPTKEQCIVTATRLLENASKIVNIRYENKIIPISVTASIGIVFDALKKHTAQDLIKFADTAMYEAKQSGKNRFVFYEE